MRLPKIIRDSDETAPAFSAGRAAAGSGRFVVGWREWTGLPDLSIARIKAKMDTGAKSSSLHADSIELFARDGAEWVRFDVSGEAQDAPWHEAPVTGRRMVRSSNGISEERCFIETALSLAGRTWKVEMSLTNREKMELPLLVGRNALAGRVLVDADRSWLCGRPLAAPAEPRRRRGARGSAEA